MSPAASLVPDRPVLVAPERFGPDLRATQVAGAVGRGLERAGLRPPDLCPVADGGPGTAEVLLTTLGGEMGDGFAVLEDGELGLVEAHRESAVTGERIGRALDAGAAVVLVAAGAAAAEDGGAGALEVLAARGGLGGARLVVLCDAAGSGGGLAEALRAAHGAVLERGGPWVLAALGFDARMRAARAVVTGAGRLGEGTLRGLVGEIGRRARQSGVPLHGVTTQDALDPFDKRMIDLQVVLEAAGPAELEAAGEALGRELAAGRAGAPPPPAPAGGGGGRPGRPGDPREPNTFSEAGLDRVGPRRADADWVAERRADPASRAVLVTARAVLLHPGDPPRPTLVPFDALGDVPAPVLLGLDGKRAVFAADGEGIELASDAAELVGLRDAAGTLGQADGGLVGYASAILNWHRRHTHCANCGRPTEIVDAGWVRRCPGCGASHHPRTDPVVIMLVTDGDRVLLGRQGSWPPGRYSALAGFVEPGESLEAAVAREVEEEAGVRVADPRYVSSQPWPFPASLMLGFTARYAGGDAAPSDSELEDVRWVTRTELASAIAGDGPIGVPPRLAIARRLMEGWLAGLDR